MDISNEQCLRDVSIAFPDGVLGMVVDVLPSLRAMALRAVLNAGLAETAVRVGPAEVVRDVVGYVRLLRGNDDVQEGKLTRVLLEMGESRVELLWPSLGTIAGCFNPHTLNRYAHTLTQLTICGASYHVPLTEIVRACPHLEVLSLEHLQCAEQVFYPLSYFGHSLKSLTITDCVGAFCNHGDGDHEWLGQMVSLCELRVPFTAFGGSMLKLLHCCANTLRVLDISDTYCNVVVDNSSSSSSSPFPALEMLCVGSENSDVNMCVVLHGLPWSVFPKLKELYVVVSRNAEVSMLWAWAATHPHLTKVQVFGNPNEPPLADPPANVQRQQQISVSCRGLNGGGGLSVLLSRLKDYTRILMG
jgi:hypothetical protein